MKTAAEHTQRTSTRRRAFVLNRRFVMVWLAWTAILINPSSLLAEVTLTDVRIGLADTIKLGKWVPVSVVLESDETVAGQLIIGTRDGEGVACNYRVEDVRLAPGRQTVTTAARLGRSEQLSLSFISETQALATIEVDPPTTTVTAWQRTIATFGAPLPWDQALRFNPVPIDESSIAITIEDASGLPEDWWGYDSIDLLVICVSNVEQWNAIDRSKKEAIVEWVRNGGRLLVSAGEHAEQVFGAGRAFEPFAPGAFQRVMKQRQTTGLETLADTSERLDLLMQDAAGRISGLPSAVFAPGAGVVELEEGFGRERSGWLYRCSVGLGLVTVVTTDLDAEVMRQWGARPRLLSKLIDIALTGDGTVEERQNLGQVSHLGYEDLTGQFRTAMEQYPGIQLVPFTVIAGLAAAYIFLIGPVDYFLLRGVIKQMRWTWLTFPLTAVAVCGLAIALAHQWKGGQIRLNEVHLVDIDGTTGLGRGTTWTHIYSPRSNDLSIHLTPRPETLRSEATTSDILFGWQGLPGTGFAAMSGRSAHGEFLRPYTIQCQQIDAGSRRQIHTELTQLSMPQWGSRSCSGTWLADFGELDAGSLRLNSDGLLAGTVRNPLDVTLRDCAVCFGRRHYEIGKLEPGEELRLVDAKLTDLRSKLTRRVIHDDKQMTSPWSPDIFDLSRILEIMMFHDAAGGRSGYTKLIHRFEGYLDMSDTVRVRHAVMIGRVSKTMCDVVIDDDPFEDPRGQRAGVCRIVLPVDNPQKTNQP